MLPAHDGEFFKPYKQEHQEYEYYNSQNCNSHAKCEDHLLQVGDLCGEVRNLLLRSMGGRAGYADYEAAYREVHGDKRGCIGAATLESDDSVAARAATPEPAAKQQAVERAREVTDLLDRIANLILIPCLCGVRIKVPPNLKRDTVACPRCGRAHAVPRVESATAKPGQAPRAMRYVRKGGGW